MIDAAAPETPMAYDAAAPRDSGDEDNARGTPEGLAFFHDHHPHADDMRADVLDGLKRPQKSIPPKYFYDAEGSRLFDRITALPEYYVTRAEIATLDRVSGALREAAGEGASVLEFGSGSGVKIRTLLGALARPHSYVAVDISREHLLEACAALARDHADVRIGAVCADFTKAFPMPEDAFGAGRRVAFFPGSTIGNFEEQEAADLLRALRAHLRAGDFLLIGADLQKESRRLDAAYDDSGGVTAAFNLNLLTRINRELGGDIPVEAFTHRARYEPGKGRVEMHLCARRDLAFTVAGERFRMRAGETIHTENSHKYTREGFDALAGQAGFRPHLYWTDSDGLFSVRLMRAA